ncbi:MAG: tyrosine-type recombinase/integrase [Caldilineaceae bacterium]|nr:tyrosine-type recombinase/integrase [Caldilineaceae bacterium]
MSKKQHKSLSISDTFRLFYLRCQAERFQPTTLEFYRSMLQPFIRWCGTQGVTELDAVTSHHIRGYMVEKQVLNRGTDKERVASGNYGHTIARALRAFFRYCVADELLTESPMASVKMPRRPKKILEAFDTADIKQLIRACNDDRDKALVHFLLDTGVRASECINIRISDVDQDTNSVRIRHGKGDKERIVYYGATTARYLVRYLLRRGEVQPSQPLWYNLHTGKPLTRSGLFQLLRKIGKAARVSQCSAHTFRRTFALSCLRNGMDIYTLAGLMGHEDIMVLRQYLAITKQDLRNAHKQFGVVDNL